MSDAPAWVRRFTATRLHFPAWADAVPDRLAVVTNRSGSWQVWAHDLTTGSWRQVSDEPIGVEEALVLPDGRIAWFRDDTGDETGRWMAQPFEGGGAEPLFPALPTGWSLGMAMAEGGRAAVGLEVDGEFRVYVVEPDGSATQRYAARTAGGVGSDWPTGRGGRQPRRTPRRAPAYGARRHPPAGAADASTPPPEMRSIETRRRPAARRGGAVVRRTSDASPSRTSSRTARARASGSSRARRDATLTSTSPATRTPCGWCPSGDALLVRHEFEGRSQLHRLDPASGSPTLVADPGGDIGDARMRPDGGVWLHTSDGDGPYRTVTADGAVAVGSPDPRRRAAAPIRDVWITNPSGDRVHALLLTPDGRGPVPARHVGPRRTGVERTPRVGRRGPRLRRRGLRGRDAELPRLDRLRRRVPRGADRQRLFTASPRTDRGARRVDRRRRGRPRPRVLERMVLGRLPGVLQRRACIPKRWRAIFAGIPAGDFVAAHQASAPELQAWDEAVYGGTPDGRARALRASATR